MEASSPPLHEVPGAHLPLKIVVTQAGHYAALKALVGQCVPILENPHSVPVARRKELARHLAWAICVEDFEAKPGEHEADGPEEQDYEPGTWTEGDI